MIGKPSASAEAKFISYTLKMVCDKGKFFIFSLSLYAY